MISESDQLVRKSSYEPPRIVTISLRPEEAVLGTCKTSSHVGPVQPTCTFTGACQVPGS